MTNKPPCPAVSDWKRLLAGDLPDREQTDLSRHLECCPVCQQQLQDLAAGGYSWQALAEHLNEGRRDRGEMLARVMDKLRDLQRAQPTQDEDEEREALSLDFLDPPVEPGQLGKLAHYEILEVIGRGGMGVIFKALDPMLHRIVAIKVMAPQLAAVPMARLRFSREAQAAAAVCHEHVVPIHAVAETKGLPYLVVQFIAGVSLQERLEKRGPLDLAEILRIGMQTALGLAAAHAQGLVHRDIKPANILLENGVERVKITDFGLARAVTDARITQSGVILGTPQYMAPEQARGEAVDRRADLFSLGSVLYFMCTGQAPFQGESSLAVLRRVCDDTPPPIREINPNTPDWLAAIIARLQAKAPDDRFQSALEVAEVLNQHLLQLQSARSAPRLSVQPITPAAEADALPVAVPEWVPPEPPRRRGRKLLAVTAAMSLLAFLGAMGYLFLGSRPDRPEQREAELAGVGSPAELEKEDLARQVRDKLAMYCYRCHGENGAVEGGFNYLMDRDQLVAHKKIRPEQPEKSRLLRRVAEGEMPPEGEKPRPGPEDIALLQRWIAAGAPAFGAAPASRTFVTDSEGTQSIGDDLAKRKERNRRFTRYFTLTHLLNSGLSEDELQSYRNGLSKLLNSLSWKKTIAVPAPIDAAKTVLRIDLRDYGWTDTEWEALLAVYPYRIDDLLPKHSEEAASTGTALAHLRGDWFVAHASRPPLYHQLLQLPRNERELEKLLHINVEANIRSEQVARAGFNDSGVSRNNRLIERHETPSGAYWKSYDFAKNTGEQNLFERPLGPGSDDQSFRHAGGEIIFNLPNGLQGYMLVNGSGERIDKGPTDIVSDPKRPDRAVENGLSCMSCHSRGLNPKTDQIRAHVLANAGAFANEEERGTILALYKPTDVFADLLREDTKRFQKAAAATGAKVGVTEPIMALAAQFEAPLDLRRAAAEVGLTPADFLANLERSPEIGRAIGALALPDGTVQRQTFGRIFSEMVTVWKPNSSSVIAQPEGRAFPLGEGHPFPPYLVGADAGVSLKDGFRLKSQHYIHTKERNLLTKDFVFELTFDSDPGGDIMLAGIGDQYPPLNGPSRISWRIHPPHLAGGYVAFGKSGAKEEDIGRIPDTGTYLLRIEKRDKALTFSIRKKSKDHFETVMTRTTPDVHSFAPFLNEHNAFLYVGNGGKLKQVRLTERTPSRDKPVTSPPSVEESPPTAAPAIPAPKLAGRVEVKLSEPFVQVRTGGGGRYLVFHLKKTKKLAIFDVAAVKVVKEIELPTEDVVYACGLDHLMIVLSNQGLIQRWGLRTFEREKSVPLPDEGPVRRAVMGCSSRGPLLLWSGGKVSFFDVEGMRLRAVEVEGKAIAATAQGGLELRASADGRTFVAWTPKSWPMNYRVMRLSGQKATVVLSPDWQSYNEHWAMPNADGSLIFRHAAGIYTGSMKLLTATNDANTVLLPTEDARFFVRLRKQSKDRAQLAISSTADRRTLWEVANLENMMSSRIYTQWGVVGGEPRIHYLPSAQVLLTLPESNDRVVLRPLDLFASLDREGQNYLFVLSAPRTRVRAGAEYGYPLDIRSKTGGVRCTLEAGPEGMSVSSGGRLRWQVPASQAGKTVNVIVTIRDSSHKEIQHSFEILAE